MNSQVKTTRKKISLSTLVGDMAQNFRASYSLPPLKALLEKQPQLTGLASVNFRHPAYAVEMLDQFQSRLRPQLYTDLSAQSPWFGSPEKRLTGLGTATLFIPVTATSLAQRHSPLTVKQRWLRMSQQADLLREQLQRKIDRMTGARAKTDEWETLFPEDE